MHMEGLPLASDKKNITLEDVLSAGEKGIIYPSIWTDGVAEVQRLDNALANLVNQHGLEAIDLNLNQEELEYVKEKAL
jgi:hypothetical protein